MKRVGKMLIRLLAMAVVVFTILKLQEPLQQKWQQMKEQVEGISLVTRWSEKFQTDAMTTQSPSSKAGYTEEKTEGASADGLSYYCYHLLIDSERQVYDQFLAGIQSMNTSFSVETGDTETVDRVYDAIVADHPELFWLGGYTVVTYMWGDKRTTLTVEPEYLLSKEEKQIREKEICQVADSIVSEAVSMYNEPYGQVRYLYETIICNTRYDENALENQNIASVFLNHASVCMGYAKSFQYLAQKLGMECVTVSGEAAGETHAWNLIRMEGEYYYVDPTWGDLNYSQPEAHGEINYLYFGMSTKDLAINHTSSLELPLCTSEQCNYYAREGILFDTFDPEQIGTLIRRRREEGEAFVTFRFRSQEAYDQARQYLIEENGVFEFCGGITNISYVEYQEYSAMTISF